MTSDLDLQYHTGQEFTRRDDCHVHCIVLSLLPESTSYSVAYPATGHVQKITEAVLMEHYVVSTVRDKADAMALLGSQIEIERTEE